MWKNLVQCLAVAAICSGCCSQCGAEEAVVEDVVVMESPCLCKKQGKNCGPECPKLQTKGAMSCTSCKKMEAPSAVPAAANGSAAAKPLDPGKIHAKKTAAHLIRSFCKNDAKAFCSKLPPDMQKEFGEKEFHASRKKLCDKFGKPVKGEFVAELAHPVFNISVWKVTFLKEIPGKPPVARQALFQVVTGEEHGKCQLLSFGFL